MKKVNSTTSMFSADTKSMQKSIKQIKRSSNDLCKKITKHSLGYVSPTSNKNNMLTFKRSEKKHQRGHSPNYEGSITSLGKGREILLGISHLDDDALTSRTSSMSTYEIRDDTSSLFTNDEFRIIDDDIQDKNEQKLIEIKNNLQKLATIEPSQIDQILTPFHKIHRNEVTSTQNELGVNIIADNHTNENDSADDSEDYRVNTDDSMVKRMFYCSENKRIITTCSSTDAFSNNIGDVNLNTSSSNNENSMQTKHTNVFLLLIELQTRTFDIIQVSLPTNKDHDLMKAILNNIILLHTSTSRNNKIVNTTAIKSQRYNGLCRPLNDVDILTNSSGTDLHTFDIVSNEILVPIPDDSNSHECSVASQGIIQMHKQGIIKVLHEISSDKFPSNADENNRHVNHKDQTKTIKNTYQDIHHDDESYNIVNGSFDQISSENNVGKNSVMKYSSNHVCNDNNQEENKIPTMISYECNNISLITHREETSYYAKIFLNMLTNYNNDSCCIKEPLAGMKNTIIAFICMIIYYNICKVIILRTVSSIDVFYYLFACVEALLEL